LRKGLQRHVEGIDKFIEGCAEKGLKNGAEEGTQTIIEKGGEEDHV
jgi:hypothetical protein